MATTLRILGKDEWEKLAAWLVANVGEEEYPPDPIMTEVLVAEEDGEIKAVLYGAFLMTLGKYNKIEGENIPTPQQMITALLDVFAASGLEGMPVAAFAADEGDFTLFDELGFAAPPVSVFVGTI